MANVPASWLPHLRKGDLVTVREHRCRAKFSARIYNIHCWMLLFHADRIHTEKLCQCKAAKAVQFAKRYAYPPTLI